LYGEKNIHWLLFKMSGARKEAGIFMNKNGIISFCDALKV
jgi:hypothetical protein